MKRPAAKRTAPSPPGSGSAPSSPPAAPAIQPEAASPQLSNRSSRAASSPEPGGSSRADWIWIGLCGGATTAFAAVLSTVVFGRIPHVQDSVAQLFQARIFAGGHLYVPSHPLREFFDYCQMINDGRWYSQYPPGHPLLLVPGVWLGVPWLVNPLLAGLGVVATALLAREIFGSAAARIAALLGLLSPFLVLMASGFMSHVSGFFAMTFFLLFYVRLLRTGRRRDAVACALFLGLSVLIRPYTAAAMSLPVFVHALWRFHKGRSAGPLVWIAAGGMAGTLLLGLYQWGTTGNPFLPGYIKLYGPSHGLGFGKGTWGPPHTLGRGLAAAWDNMKALNSRLFLWPLSSLWPMAVALLPLDRRPSSHGDAGPHGQGPRRPAGGSAVSAGSARWMLVSFPLAVLMAYVFYWYHDLCFGPRFLYDALGPTLALSAFGLLRTGNFLAGRLAPRARGWMRAGPGAALGMLLFAYAFAVGWPGLFRAPGYARGAAPDSAQRRAGYFACFNRQYWGTSPYLGRLLRENGIMNNALVFTDFTEPEIHFKPLENVWFGSAFVEERPDLSHAGVILAHDRGKDDERLIRAFPGRRIYIYRGTIESGELYELRAEGKAASGSPGGAAGAKPQGGREVEPIPRESR